MIKDTDQWLKDGDCTKCRKDEYCTKECKPRKQLVEMKMTEILNRAFKKTFLKQEENKDEVRESE